MIEVNAAGARVPIRDVWRAFLFMFLTGGFYRLFWFFSLNRDLARYGRARDPQHDAWIRVRPIASAFALAMGMYGAFQLNLFVFPWGLAATANAEHHPVHITTAALVVYGVLGVANLVPAAISMIRTMQRVRVARSLGGLGPRRLTSWGLFVPILLVELLGVPVAMFALQASANELWRQYPRLDDEDVYGELAPATARPELAAQRPTLQLERELRAAGGVENARVTPWVTLAVAAVCIVLFLVEVSRFGFNPDDHQLISMGALDAKVHGIWWHFIAANFLHANVEHIAGNLPVWVLLGTRVERAYGSRRMALLVAMGVAGSSIGSLLAFPNEPGLGVSGVIFAMVAAGVARDLRARRPLGRFSWTIFVVGGLGSFGGGIDWGAHLGGAIAGFVFAIVVGTVWRMPMAWAMADPRDHLRSVDPDAPLAPVRPDDLLARLAHLETRARTGELTATAFTSARAELLAGGT